MAKERLPDSLFIFVMCCCAIAIGAVVFVFVYYCYLNGKVCFRGRAPVSRGRRYRNGQTGGGPVRLGAPEDASDDDAGAEAIDMMEARLLQHGGAGAHTDAELQQPSQPHFGHRAIAVQHSGTQSPPAQQDSYPLAKTANEPAVMDAAAMSRAKFTTENVKIRNLDAGDDHTVSGVNAPRGGDRAAAAAYYDGSERLEFLVLPEKATSVVATASAGSGGDAAAAAEEASTASGASTAQRRFLGEWLAGVVKALRESQVTGVPLEDPAPQLSPSASSPYSSDQNTDTEHGNNAPMVPTARRLQMLHRLSRASDSSMSTQPSTTVPGQPPGHSPPQSLPSSPQAAGPRSGAAVPPQPVLPVASRAVSRPSRRGTGNTTSTQPARPGPAHRPSPPPPGQPSAAQPAQAPQFVTLAQLMEDPFGRNMPQGAPVVLTPDVRREALFVDRGTDDAVAAQAEESALPPPPQVAPLPSAKRSPPPAGAHAASGGAATPRRILSDTTSSSTVSGRAT